MSIQILFAFISIDYAVFHVTMYAYNESESKGYFLFNLCEYQEIFIIDKMI